MGLIINELINGKDHLAVWHTSESIEYLEKEFFDKGNSGDDYNAYKTIKLDKNKMQWLATRLALRAIKQDDPTIQYDEHGAPWLEIEGWEISISHSGGWAAVLLSQRSLVGVDLQIFNEKVTRIATKFLHNDEYNQWKSNDNIDYLLALWTIKESVFKIFKHNQKFSQIHITSKWPFYNELIHCEVERETKTYSFMVHHRKLNDFYLSYAIL